MPKHNIILEPGEEIESNLLLVLEKYFTKKDFAKLNKLGGRIQLSITAPFYQRAKENVSREIDEAYISKLTKNIDFAKAELKEMKKEELVEISKMINLPFQSNANKSEIANRLIEYLESDKNWNAIINSSND
jgi:hypothetical protein